MEQAEAQMLNLYSLLVVFALQCFGAWQHWELMRKEGRTSGTYWEYLTSQYPGKSVLTVFMVAANAVISSVGGAADYLNPELLLGLLTSGQIDLRIAASIVGAVTLQIGAGYAFDSRFNGGSDGKEQSSNQEGAKNE